MNSYKTVYKGGSGEIIEKKSRFIASVFPCEDEETALAFIENIKKTYWDARHNCYAYIIGDTNPVMRCSDDGEPAKTAGRPMLDILIGEELVNVCVVVTRYFGGVLLGTGGLVRAYQAAVKEGLNNCTVITKKTCMKLRIRTDYNGVGKLQYIAASLNITALSVDYTDIVTAVYAVPLDLLSEFEKKITEATLGKAVISEEENIFFAEADGEIILF